MVLVNARRIGFQRLFYSGGPYYPIPDLPVCLIQVLPLLSFGILPRR